MITELVLDFFHALAVTVFAWVKNEVPAPPSWVADLSDGLSTALGMVPDSIRYFVPLGPVAAAGLAFVGLLVAVGLIRVARRVLSLFTGGGGNA